MNLNIKNRLNKLYKSSWFITLFATTLGVLLAFYLNNISFRSKIENRKQISIQNINNELSSNESALLDSKDNDRLIDFLNRVKKIDNKITTELTTTVNSINILRKNYSDFMKIKDSTIIDTKLNKYNVAYKFELNLDDLQKIAWETSKMSDIINEIDYGCLQALVKIYSLQEIYIKEQQKVLNHFVNAEHDKLLSVMLILQQLKSQLLKVVNGVQEDIINCG